MSLTNVSKDDCIVLNKYIHGLIQAARQYSNKVVKILRKAGFIRCNIKPCIYVTKSAYYVAYIALYVDNNSMANDEVIVALNENGLVSKFVEGLQVICPVKESFLWINRGLG